MLRVFVAALALCGCVGATGRGVDEPATVARTGPAETLPATGVPPAWRLCAGDADCVRAPADCCGCISGGRDTALAAAWADAWSERLRKSCESSCPDVYIPPEACAAPPRCEEGTCVLE